jgi:tRNA pseudouridine55 synthase
MDLASRALWVEQLVVTARPDPDHVDLEMTCGKGGYVRSIARDLGAALGCLGHVAWLRRIWSGPFHADEGVTLDLIDAEAKSDTLDARLLPLETALKDLPEFPVTPEGAARLRNGNPGQVLAHADWGAEGWASLDGQAIAIGHYRGGELHPSRVFNR